MRRPNCVQVGSKKRDGDHILQFTVPVYSDTGAAVTGILPHCHSPTPGQSQRSGTQGQLPAAPERRHHEPPPAASSSPPRQQALVWPLHPVQGLLSILYHILLRGRRRALLQRRRRHELPGQQRRRQQQASQVRCSSLRRLRWPPHESQGDDGLVHVCLCLRDLCDMRNRCAVLLFVFLYNS